MHKDEANTLTQPIWMEGERSGWIMPARWSSARSPVRAGELWPAVAGSGADELCPAAASVRAEELRHVRRGRRQAPPGRREHAPGELRPSRHGCAWRAAAPRPPQVQAKASSARPPVRARELRPAATGAGAGELCPVARSRSPGPVPPWHVHVGCGRWRGKFWISSDSLK